MLKFEKDCFEEAGRYATNDFKPVS